MFLGLHMHASVCACIPYSYTRGEATHIEIANQNLITGQLIADYKPGYLWIHNPMKHTDSLFDHRSKISIDVNRHHSFGCLL